MNAAKLIPIIPRSGLYLCGHGHGDDRRFARLFRETWVSLPLTARRRMLKHWREDERRGMRGFWCMGPTQAYPTIQLLFSWFRTESDLYAALDLMPEEEPQPFAQVFGGGHTLRFLAAAVDRMPDDVVRRLIAHELAHVHQFASGGLGADCEDDAERLAGAWGYSDQPIREWDADTSDAPWRSATNSRNG